MRLIDADKLMPRLWDYISDYDYEKVKKVVNEMLEAEPERKSGKWIKKSNISPFYTMWWYECSECGQYPPKDVYNQESLTNYCPHCGAKMEDEE